MKTILKTIIALLSVTALDAAIAAPVTIDFEGTSVTEVSAGSEYLSRGYRFTVFDPYGPPDEPGQTPPATISWCSNCETGNLWMLNAHAVMERADGGTFALHQYDVAELISFSGPQTTTVTGITASGAMLEFSPDVLCNPAPCNEWGSHVLGPEWTNLVSVSFSAYIFPQGAQFIEGRIDNIVVSNVVPLPAAVWLLLSALTILTRFRRANR